jgi:cobaltochelatase CobS
MLSFKTLSAAQKRSVMRKAFGRMMKAGGFPTTYFAQVVNVSDSSVVRNATPTQSGFRDLISPRALFAIVSGSQSMSATFEALKNIRLSATDAKGELQLGVNIANQATVFAAWDNPDGGWVKDPLVQKDIHHELVAAGKTTVHTPSAVHSTATTTTGVTHEMAKVVDAVNAFSILTAQRIQVIRAGSAAGDDELGKSKYASSVSDSDDDIAKNERATIIGHICELVNDQQKDGVASMLMELSDQNPEFHKLPATDGGRVVASTVASSHLEYYTNAPATTEPAASAEPVAPTISVRPEFSAILNATLQQATDGKVQSMEAILDMIKSATATATSLEREVERLKLAASTVVPMPTEVAASGEMPEGKIVMVKASDIFRGPNGRKTRALEFEVPTIQWSGPNPHVPLLDPNYRFQPRKLLQFLFAMRENKKAWLHGHTGTGKTTFVEQVCARLGYMFMRVNLDSEITRMDLIGRDTLVTDDSGNTVSKFVEGILPTAMTLGGIGAVLCCDEVSFGRPEVMYVFQRALEDKGLLLSEDGGRVVHPCPMFRMVATDNTRGQGDDMGAYQGARPQSSAFLDRFTVWIEFEYMKPAEEAELVQDVVPLIPANVAENLANLATEIRAAFINGSIYQTCSPRGVITAAEGFVFFHKVTGDVATAVELALETTILSKASPQDCQTIKGLADRCMKAA